MNICNGNPGPGARVLSRGVASPLAAASATDGKVEERGALWPGSRRQPRPLY